MPASPGERHTRRPNLITTWTDPVRLSPAVLALKPLHPEWLTHATTVRRSCSVTKTHLTDTRFLHTQLPRTQQIIIANSSAGTCRLHRFWRQRAAISSAHHKIFPFEVLPTICLPISIRSSTLSQRIPRGHTIPFAVLLIKARRDTPDASI